MCELFLSRIQKIMGCKLACPSIWVKTGKGKLTQCTKDWHEPPVLQHSDKVAPYQALPRWSLPLLQCIELLIDCNPTRWFWISYLIGRVKDLGEGGGGCLYQSCRLQTARHTQREMPFRYRLCLRTADKAPYCNHQIIFQILESSEDIDW